MKINVIVTREKLCHFAEKFQYEKIKKQARAKH